MVAAALRRVAVMSGCRSGCGERGGGAVVAGITGDVRLPS